MDFSPEQEGTQEEVAEHYKIEKELAEKLRTANRAERIGLYAAVYDELFKRVPYHSQLMRKKDSSLRMHEVAEQMSLLNRFLKGNKTFLEVGSGDCALAFEVAKNTKRVYAVDVSREITASAKLPKNFELILTDGFSVPVMESSIDVAFSHDFVEHLHPEDFREHLKTIFSKLAPNGLYVCMTPNRLSGPHDISRDFDATATGFHLKEYTVLELHGILLQNGFGHLTAYVGGKGIYLRSPLVLIKAIEKTLIALPHSISKKVSRTLPVMALLGISLIAKKR